MIITIPGKPVPWQRARRRGNRYFDPQAKIKAVWRMHLKTLEIAPQPLKTGVKLKIRCYMPIPKSWSKNRRLNANGKPHTSRPDLDNLAKFVGDCYNGILWEDDGLIWKAEVEKVYGNEPRTEIEIEGWEG